MPEEKLLDFMVQYYPHKIMTIWIAFIHKTERTHQCLDNNITPLNQHDTYGSLSPQQQMLWYILLMHYSNITGTVCHHGIECQCLQCFDTVALLSRILQQSIMLHIQTSMHGDKVFRTIVIDYNCSITSLLCIQYLHTTN